MYERIAPDEPTKAPVIIKAEFSKVNQFLLQPNQNMNLASK